MASLLMTVTLAATSFTSALTRVPVTIKSSNWYSAAYADGVIERAKALSRVARNTYLFMVVFLSL